ncbi:peptidyl-tRNA hydrolase [Flagelloscypha sp. PMI_526]|nr:peptidyl-tRNA hydrolase [Flagelloscypha sp. PMI_526]
MSSLTTSTPKIYVAGLGNLPFPRTRHSVGQVVVDSLASRLGLMMSNGKEGYRAQGLVTLGETRVDLVLFKPKKAMNISGPSIAHLLPSRSSTNSNLVVLSDSLSHKPKTVHNRLGGSANGHNGLKSLITALGNNNQFWQMRLGIGSNRGREGRDVDSADYVMENLTPEELNYWSPRGEGIELVLKELENIVLKASEPTSRSQRPGNRKQQTPKKSKT